MAKRGSAGESGRAPVIGNPKARHKYDVLDTWDCGVSLLGPEVKSLREGRASLDEAYARFRNGELWLLKMRIDEYRDRGQVKSDPARPRKLLLHRSEIAVIRQEVERRGLTLVPLRLHWNERGIAKVEIALVKGRKLHDKREAEKKKVARREIDRIVRRR